MVWKPDVTVAAVVERDGAFLLVEEQATGQLVLNQPAGHLEDRESLIEAVIRETREETAWGFEPEFLVGIYLWKSPVDHRSFLRIAFGGQCRDHDPEQELDHGILRTHWLTRAKLLPQQNRLRSPMVLYCIDDYLAGVRHQLDLLNHIDFREIAATG